MKKRRYETTMFSWSCFGIAGVMSVLSILLLLIIPKVAHAAEFSVSNVTELVGAINSANDEINYSGPDTINMAKGFYTLTKVENDTDGPNGLPSIISEITIYGDDSTIERSEVSDIPLFRIFHIDRTGRLSLNDLTISSGNVTDSSGNVTDKARGGGLYNNGFLKLTTCIVKGNQAGRGILDPNIFGYGGGLYNHEGDVIIDSCGFSGNIGTYGGGIYNERKMSISNSTINNNRSGLWAGGGIRNSGTLTITSSTISGNIGGEGILNSSKISAIFNSTFAVIRCNMTVFFLFSAFTYSFFTSQNSLKRLSYCL